MNQDEMVAIVFINGAGLNSSIWAELQKELNLPTLAIEFPNRQSTINKNGTLSFDYYINTTIEQIKNWQKENFIIVAHSIGACIGLKVAEHFKHELKGFVAIGSIIPVSGQSFAAAMPFPQNTLLPILLNLFGTKPPKKAIEAELCNDLSPETSTKIVSDFTPEAKSLYTTKINFDLPVTNRLYIKLSNDKSIPPNLQDKMAKNLNATKLETLNSGHLPMLSKPNELAIILKEFLNIDSVS